ncbi:MAG TPA: murein biosynthesis integral membrane protein MurJ [Acidimicrobiales bacterium]|nr:murein biosynthesis integral membrane protein MurJ [Acidimicrobiales bacterium]
MTLRARGRRLAALAASLMVVLAASAVASPSPAAAQTAPGAGSANGGTNSPIGNGELQLRSQSTWVANNGTFQVGVSVKTPNSVADQLQVTLYGALPSRTDFTASLGGRFYTPRLYTFDPVAVATVGTSPSFAVAVNHQLSGGHTPSVYLSVSGVYPVTVDLYGSNGALLSRLVTYLVYNGPDAASNGRLDVAWVAPFTAPPASKGITAKEQAGLQALTQALAAHPNIPVTVDATPQTVEAMATGTGTERATVAQLAQLLGGGDELVGSPYVRLDVPSMQAAGLDGELGEQLATGQQVLVGTLRATPDAAAWVEPGPVTPASVDDLAGRGVRQMVVSPNSLSSLPAEDLTRTPAQPFSIMGKSSRVAGLAMDQGLAAHFVSMPDEQLAAQQLLAELAMIQYELPNRRGGRGVVIVPPSGWQADAAFLEPFLNGLSSAPMLAPVTVNGLFSGVTPLPGGGGFGTSLVRSVVPLDQQPKGQPISDGAAIRVARSDVISLAAVVPAGTPAIAAADRQVLISESADIADRNRPSAVAAATAMISHLKTMVRLPGNQSITFTARQGRIPITMLSSAPYPLKVRLEMSSVKLAFQPVDVPGGRCTGTGSSEVCSMVLAAQDTTIRVPVVARTTGVFSLTVSLDSPDGVLNLATNQDTVRSTAASGVGVILSILAVLLLAVWWLRDVRHSRRARRLVPKEVPGPTLGAPTPTTGPAAAPGLAAARGPAARGPTASGSAARSSAASGSAVSGSAAPGSAASGSAASGSAASRPGRSSAPAAPGRQVAASGGAVRTPVPSRVAVPPGRSRDGDDAARTDEAFADDGRRRADPRRPRPPVPVAADVGRSRASAPVRAVTARPDPEERVSTSRGGGQAWDDWGGWRDPSGLITQPIPVIRFDQPETLPAPAAPLRPSKPEAPPTRIMRAGSPVPPPPRTKRPEKTPEESFSRNTVLMAGGTMMSRITGFGRVLALIWAFGITSGITDVYNVANTVPNIIYDLVLGGILSATLVPVFVDYLNHDDPEEGRRAISAVVTVIAVTLIVISAVFWLLAPLIIRFYFLLNKTKIATSDRVFGTSLLHMFVPQLFLLGGIAVSTALLNARRRFAAAAFSPVVNNLVAIVAIVGARVLAGSVTVAGFRHDQSALLLLGLGTTAGYLFQFAVQIPPMLRAGLRLRPVWDLGHPAVRTVLRLSLWTFGAVVANQISFNLILVLAEHKNSDVTVFNTAYQFFQLPYAIFAVSIASVITTELAEHWTRRDLAGFRRDMAAGMRLTLAVLIPAAVGYVVLAQPFLHLVLRHGSVSAGDTHRIASVVVLFAAGLPGFSVYLLLMRGYQAMQDTRSMFWLYVLENAATLVLAGALYPLMGVGGLALGWVGAYSLGAVAAFSQLRRRTGGLDGRVIAGGLLRIGAATALMTLPVFAFGHLFHGTSDLAELGQVTGGVITGGVVYLAAAHAFGVTELTTMLRRRGTR